MGCQVNPKILLPDEAIFADVTLEILSPHFELTNGSLFIFLLHRSAAYVIPLPQNEHLRMMTPAQS